MQAQLVVNLHRLPTTPSPSDPADPSVCQSWTVTRTLAVLSHYKQQKNKQETTGTNGMQIVQMQEHCDPQM